MFILGFTAGIVSVGFVVVAFMTVEIIKEWFRRY